MCCWTAASGLFWSKGIVPLARPVEEPWNGMKGSRETSQKENWLEPVGMGTQLALLCDRGNWGCGTDKQWAEGALLRYLPRGSSSTQAWCWAKPLKWKLKGSRTQERKDYGAFRAGEGGGCPKHSSGEGGDGVPVWQANREGMEREALTLTYERSQLAETGGCSPPGLHICERNMLRQTWEKLVWWKWLTRARHLLAEPLRASHLY